MPLNENQKYESYSIVFFDGVCNFCNSTVDWVFKKNKAGNLYFSSLQSDFAKEFLPEKGIDIDMSTIYFYDKGKVRQRSRAVFNIMKYFTGWAKFSGQVLSIFPSFLSDFFYNIIARNRHRILGKRETCRLPTPEEKSRFLE